MRAVRGAVVSSKPVALAKAARVFNLFAASEASGLPADAGALVLCAAEAAAELHVFRRRAGLGGDAREQSTEKRPKKRRRRSAKANEATTEFGATVEASS